MFIKYKNNSDIELSTNYSKIDASYKDQINSAIAKLIENDNSILPTNDNVPDIWTCYWYNYDIDGQQSAEYRSLYGYNRGEAVWLNTESLDEFTTAQFQQISAVVSENTRLTYYLRNLKTQDDQYEFFKKIVTGDVTGNSRGYPLYYIGQLSNRIQIKVSLHDNNVDLPTVESSWADFFDYDISAKNEQRIIDTLSSSLSSNLLRHLYEYHLSIDFMNAAQLRQLGEILSQFVKKDLSSNLSSIDCQNYTSHSTLVNMHGFDFVHSFRIKKHETNSKCMKWFRYWNSGYLEQGGVICINNGLFNDSVESFYDDRRLTVKLPIEYDYTRNFQVKPCQINDEQVLSNMLNNDKAYQVSVTPLINNGTTPYSVHNTYSFGQSGLSANFYNTIEIANSTNKSFQIILNEQENTDYDGTYYSFYTCGFITRKMFYSELWYGENFGLENYGT